MFKEETKQFHRYLGPKLKDERPPTYEKIELCWKPLWDKVQHNEKVECIRRERKEKN
jgi:hypothetical protein